MSFLPPKDMMDDSAGKRPEDRKPRYKRKEQLDPAPEVSGMTQEETPKMRVSGFGPPKYENNDEQQEQPKKRLPYDEAQLQRAYQAFSEEEREGDEDYMSEDETPEEDGEEYLSDVAPQSLRQPGGAFLKDEPLFPGGPLISEVNSWKKQFEVDGHAVMMSDDIGGETFIWRTLSRTEYKEIMNLPNTDPLQREEIICEICVLFPYNYKFDTMAARKAGIPAVLAEQILHESGFKKPSPPIRL